MILSDRSLREQIDAGRIVIEPFDPSLIQPSSIDVKIGNLFRVFRNHTAAVIEGDYPADVLLGMSWLGRVTLREADGVLYLGEK